MATNKSATILTTGTSSSSTGSSSTRSTSSYSSMKHTAISGISSSMKYNYSTTSSVTKRTTSSSSMKHTSSSSGSSAAKHGNNSSTPLSGTPSMSETPVGTLLKGAKFYHQGLVLQDLWLSVPLDHFSAEFSVNIDAGEDYPKDVTDWSRPIQSRQSRRQMIQIFIKEVILEEKEHDNLPPLIFLEGGPGYPCPRAIQRNGWIKRALQDYRVYLLDQRGAGFSSPLKVDGILFERLDPQGNYRYITDQTICLSRERTRDFILQTTKRSPPSPSLNSPPSSFQNPNSLSISPLSPSSSQPVASQPIASQPATGSASRGMNLVARVRVNRTGQAMNSSSQATDVVGGLGIGSSKPSASTTISATNSVPPISASNMTTSSANSTSSSTHCTTSSEYCGVPMELRNKTAFLSNMNTSPSRHAPPKSEYVSLFPHFSIPRQNSFHLRRKRTPREQVVFIKHFLADSIAEDLECFRKLYFHEGTKLNMLGQSYGGFIALRYLSIRPNHLGNVFFTGGLPPVGSNLDIDDIYRGTYRRLIARNDAFYRQYPENVERARVVTKYLTNVDTRLHITNARFSARRFLQLGLCLGSGAGFSSLHTILKAAFHEGEFGKRYAALEDISDSEVDETDLEDIFEKIIETDEEIETDQKMDIRETEHMQQTKETSEKQQGRGENLRKNRENHSENQHERGGNPHEEGENHRGSDSGDEIMIPIRPECEITTANTSECVLKNARSSDHDVTTPVLSKVSSKETLYSGESICTGTTAASRRESLGVHSSPDSSLDSNSSSDFSKSLDSSICGRPTPGCYDDVDMQVTPIKPCGRTSEIDVGERENSDFQMVRKSDDLERSSDVDDTVFPTPKRQRRCQRGSDFLATQMTQSCRKSHSSEAVSRKESDFQRLFSSPGKNVISNTDVWENGSRYDLCNDPELFSQDVSSEFLSSASAAQPFGNQPLYALLQEAIYMTKPGRCSAWSAQRMMLEFPELVDTLRWVQRGGDDDVQRGGHEEVQRGGHEKVQRGGHEDMQRGSHEEVQRGGVVPGADGTHRNREGADRNKDGIRRDGCGATRRLRTADRNTFRLPEEKASKTSLFFLGEMVFPWMFEEEGYLAELKECAHLLHQETDWKHMYDFSQYQQLRKDFEKYERKRNTQRKGHANAKRILISEHPHGSSHGLSEHQHHAEHESEHRHPSIEHCRNKPESSKIPRTSMVPSEQLSETQRTTGSYSLSKPREMFLDAKDATLADFAPEIRLKSRLKKCFSWFQRLQMSATVMSSLSSVLRIFSFDLHRSHILSYRRALENKILNHSMNGSSEEENFSEKSSKQCPNLIKRQLASELESKISTKKQEGLPKGLLKSTNHHVSTNVSSVPLTFGEQFSSANDSTLLSNQDDANKNPNIQEQSKVSKSSQKTHASSEFSSPSLVADCPRLAAVVYYDDMYVDRIFSEKTAASLPGIKLWITNEYQHSGLLDDGYNILDKLFSLIKDTSS